jgi:tetratricopeptide (TPR) repeat protein
VAIGFAQQTATPTFNRDIAPILMKRCAGCHRPDGDAPFSLVTFADVRPRATLLRDVTRRRYMPPWKPEPGYGDFEGARRLSNEEIRVIGQWVDNDLPEGDPSDRPAAIRWSGSWQLGEPDLVVRLPEYVLPAEGSDVFRNFVVPISVDRERYVRAIQFRPGGRGVHHANIRVDPTPASRRLDEADPAPGYEGLILHSADYPEGHFLGWTPGQATPGSSDLAWRLDARADFVVQLHMQPTGRREAIAPAIALYFSDGPPRRTPAIVRLGRQTLDIPAGADRYVVDDHYVVPVDVEVHAIQPHAHYRAREVRAVATLPDGTRRELLWIRNWDFNWQDQYRYRSPFWLPAGTTIALKYEFDNSAGNPRNPVKPPQRARWGWRSVDEMGDLWIQVLTRSDADRRQLLASARNKMRLEDAAGSEVLIEREPAHVSLRNDAALIYMELGRPLDALKHFETVTRLESHSATARYNEGVALEAARRDAEALKRYEEAIGLDPQYAAAHNNLGTMLLAAGRAAEAVVHYRRAVELSPTNAEARNNLGGLLVATAADLDEAIAHLREALRLRPDFPDPHFNLGRAHTRAGRGRDALAEYRAALVHRPDWAACLTNLAWLLAAHPDVGLRNPSEARRAAEHAVAVTGRQDTAALDVLGVAYAANGRFDEAAAAASGALDAATRSGQIALAAEIRERLELYRQGKPFMLR